MLKKTKIVCTLGPASRDEKVMEGMLRAGMNVARLNFSHGTHEEHRKTIETFRKVRDRLDIPAAVLLDTKGPEIRLGDFENGSETIEEGQIFTLTSEECRGSKSRVCTTYKALPSQVEPGTRILIDDGRIRLEVTETTETEVVCRVLAGGKVSNRKGVNIPGKSLDLEYISPGDRQDILFGIRMDVDYVAASFVRNEDDVKQLRKLLCDNGIREYAVSETQKYGHVTYFWNGNRSGKVSEALETYEEIPSDVIPFEQAPAMKSREITDRMIAAMESKNYEFLRCNFPNGDMVGHTGVMEAVVTAMECVDASLKRILDAADRLGYTVLITADHGNADQMTETKKGKTSVRTAHSLNPVPFIIYDPDNKYVIREGHYGLANVAPTVAALLGLSAPACWEASMI